MKLLIPLLLLLTGCLASMPMQELNPATYYVNDICITYETGKKIKVPADMGEDDWWRNTNRTENEKKTFCGVGTMPYRASYDITVKNKGKLNFFAMTTCHRERTSANPDKGIFRKNGVIKIKYTPTIEQGKACPLFIAAFNRKGRHGWGVVAFENPRFKLNANIECNGFKYTARGVGICQSRQGLIQRIVFDEEVVQSHPTNGAAERKEDCPALDTKDNKTFEYRMPPRECVYSFVSKKTRRINKFYTVGYEQLIVRE